MGTLLISKRFHGDGGGGRRRFPEPRLHDLFSHRLLSPPIFSRRTVVFLRHVTAIVGTTTSATVPQIQAFLGYLGSLRYPLAGEYQCHLLPDVVLDGIPSSVSWWQSTAEKQRRKSWGWSAPPPDPPP